MSNDPLACDFCGTSLAGCLAPHAFDDGYCCPRCEHSEAPTPPLVAASPVPPVVPDREAMCAGCLHTHKAHIDGHDCLCEGYRRSGSAVVPDREASEDFYGHGGASEHRTCGTRAFCYGCSLSCYPSTEPGLPCPCCQNALDARASGSGVVPDKPALVPEPPLVVFRAALDAFHDVETELDVYWEARKPIQGEATPKVFAYRMAKAVLGANTDAPAVTDDEAAAEAFHEAYERLAPSFSYKTRKASAVLWANVPENNKRLMVAVIADLRSAGFLLVRDHTKET